MLLSTHRAPRSWVHAEVPHSQSQGTLGPGTTSRLSFPGSLQWCPNLTETVPEPSGRRSPFPHQTQLMPPHSPHRATCCSLIRPGLCNPLQFSLPFLNLLTFYPSFKDQLKPCHSHEDFPGAQQLLLWEYSLMAQHEPGESSSRS